MASNQKFELTMFIGYVVHMLNKTYILDIPVKNVPIIYLIKYEMTRDARCFGRKLKTYRFSLIL